MSLIPKSNQLQKITAKEWDTMVVQVQDTSNGHTHNGTDSKTVAATGISLTRTLLLIGA